MISRVAATMLLCLILSGCSVSSDDEAGPKSPASTNQAPSATTSPGSPSVEPSPAADPVITLVDSGDPLPRSSQVGVSGEGFRPSSRVVLAQCAGADVTAMADDCNLKYAAEVVADADGRFRGDLRFTTWLQFGSRLEQGCVDNVCAIVAGDSDTETAIASTEVAVAPDAKIPTRPSLSIDEDLEQNPSDPNARRAFIRGSGFTAHEEVNLVMCPTVKDQGVAAGDCLFSYSANIRADPNGDLTVPMQVFVKFQRSDGELINCSTTDLCVIANVYPKMHGTPMARVALRIDD